MKKDDLGKLLAKLKKYTPEEEIVEEIFNLDERIVNKLINVSDAHFYTAICLGIDLSGIINLDDLLIILDLFSSIEDRDYLKEVKRYLLNPFIINHHEQIIPTLKLINKCASLFNVEAVVNCMLSNRLYDWNLNLYVAELVACEESKEKVECISKLHNFIINKEKYQKGLDILSKCAIENVVRYAFEAIKGHNMELAEIISKTKDSDNAYEIYFVGTYYFLKEINKAMPYAKIVSLANGISGKYVCRILLNKQEVLNKTAEKKALIMKNAKSFVSCEVVYDLLMDEASFSKDTNLALASLILDYQTPSNQDYLLCCYPTSNETLKLKEEIEIFLEKHSKSNIYFNYAYDVLNKIMKKLFNLTLRKDILPKDISSPKNKSEERFIDYALKEYEENAQEDIKLSEFKEMVLKRMKKQK